MTDKRGDGRGDMVLTEVQGGGVGRRVEQRAAIIGDIPNKYTNDVVLNQQASVAHGGGTADSLPGDPVARSPCRYRTQELMADP
jgi:hypothetical protein